MIQKWMIDLGSGLGGASDPFVNAGWKVITVDINPDFNPTFCLDILKNVENISRWAYKGKPPVLIWASPDCTEFCKDSLPLSWICNRNSPPKPDIALMKACKKIIDLANPSFWVIENVRGAVKYFEPELGPVIKKIGNLYLWGNFPLFDTSPKYGKEKIGPSPDRAALRSLIPAGVSLSLLKSIEWSGGF